MTTAPTDTSAVFIAQTLNHVWLNSRSKCLSVGGTSNHSGNFML
jgi:hypothetical protein